MTRSTQIGVKPTRRGGKRARGALAGPRREVVYIFDRKGDHGGLYWLLVLECGHAATRSRAKVGMATLMIRRLSEITAPKRVQCIHCEAGHPPGDPWTLIEAFGGPARP